MSFICNGKPDYQWRATLKKLEPHVFQQFMYKAGSLRNALDAKRGLDKEPEVITQANLSDLYLHDGLLMDAEEVQAWNDVGIDVAVSRIKGIASNARDLQSTIFQVCIAGIGPMQIRCVDYIKGEDQIDHYACEEVNNWIKKGWRILSVVQPPDCSFPTFVMGHVDEEPHR